MGTGRGIVRGVALVAGALAIGAGTASGSTLVGTASPWGTSAKPTWEVPSGATVFNVSDSRPGSQLAAPSAGVVTRWRTEGASDAIAVQLQIVRPSGEGQWQIVASGAVQRRIDGRAIEGGSGARTEWPVRIPIAAGDQLALHQAAPTSAFAFGAQPGPVATRIFRDQAVGSAPSFGSFWMSGEESSADALGLNADVEPDADGDGWGDETQDACPGLASQDQSDHDRDGRGDACDPDDDDDGLSDVDEQAHGTDPLRADSDRDGLGDGDEVARGTDPTKADSDDDGLGDAAELAVGTDPRNPDSDGDRVLDGADRCPRTDGGGAADGCPLPGGPSSSEDAPPTVRFAVPGGPVTLKRDAVLALRVKASDDHGVREVEVRDGALRLCRWTSGPFKCRWRPTGASVGRRTLTAIARDGRGAVATARLLVRVPRFLTAGVSATPTLTTIGDALRIDTSGRLRLPARVDAAQGCSGQATIRIKRAAETLSARRVDVGRDCRFSSSVTMLRKLVPGRRLRVLVRFGGNDVLMAEDAAERGVRVPDATGGA